MGEKRKRDRKGGKERGIEEDVDRERRGERESRERKKRETEKRGEKEWRVREERESKESTKDIYDTSSASSNAYPLNLLSSSLTCFNKPI
jgi:hypothetical protein